MNEDRRLNRDDDQEDCYLDVMGQPCTAEPLGDRLLPPLVPLLCVAVVLAWRAFFFFFSGLSRSSDSVLVLLSRSVQVVAVGAVCTYSRPSTPVKCFSKEQPLSALICGACEPPPLERMPCSSEGHSIE